MIQKHKQILNFPQIHQKYHFDKFSNPYVPKLSIRLAPRARHSQLYHTISPFSSQNDLSIYQSMPLYRNQKHKLAIIWKGYFSTIFSRTHIGLSYQRKMYQKYRIKSKILTGTTSIIDFQLSRFVGKDSQIFLGYGGFVQNLNIFSSLTAGFRKGIFSLMGIHKIQGPTTIKLGISKDIMCSSRLNLSVSNKLNYSQIEVNSKITNKYSQSLQISCGVFCNVYQKQLGLRLQCQKLITKNQKIGVSGQFIDGKSIFYFTLKNMNFNLALPLVIVQSPLPIVVGFIAFTFSYLFSKNKTKKSIPSKGQTKQKSQEQRQQQLKLIGQKANDFYEKQRRQENGLLIEQAYIGPRQQIQQFMNNPRRINLLITNQQYKNKFIDLTLTLRFYTSKGQLLLIKGNKSKLIGFYKNSAYINKIAIKYVRHGQQKIVYFNQQDEIKIKINDL